MGWAGFWIGLGLVCASSLVCDTWLKVAGL